jgi:FkbM family methyltransferase
MILAAPSRFPPVALVLDTYEPATTKLLQSIMKPGMTFVDVGAHVGYYSLLAARQVGPQGKVYAFEPEPVNYSLLIKNVELNGYSNVSAKPKAVSGSVGSTALHISALDSGRNSVYRHGLPEQGSVQVDTTTLDAFFEAKSWPKIDLIKMDVEGAEQDVLNGMIQLLKKTENLKIIMEFNPALLHTAGVDPLQFLAEPAKSGFKIYTIDETSGLVPIEEAGILAMVDRMSLTQSSINLLCTKE